ncbi:Copper-transporting ATPase RAN1 [Linum grandiflorum]
MTCAACSNSVESALRGINGVVSASVALLQNRADVVFDPSLVKEKRFSSLIVWDMLNFLVDGLPPVATADALIIWVSGAVVSSSILLIVLLISSTNSASDHLVLAFVLWFRSSVLHDRGFVPR